MPISGANCEWAASDFFARRSRYIQDRPLRALLALLLLGRLARRVLKVRLAIIYAEGGVINIL